MNEQGRIQRMFQEGRNIVGTHIRSQDPFMSEMLAKIGFDILWIENEHAGLDKYTTMLHIMAAQAGGAAAIVRVPWNDPVLVKPILEMGTDGIVFPMVSTADEARRAVAACCYPPRGVRGFGPLRANEYGLIGKDEYLKKADRQLFKLIQIEDIRGVENIEEIASVEGVDGLIVGQFDLTGTMEMLGEINHPKTLACIRKVFEAGHRHGIPCGMSSTPDPEQVRVWRELGADFIFSSTEYEWVKLAAEPALRAIRGTKETEL